MLGIVVGLAAEARLAAGLGGRIGVGGGSTAGAARAAQQLLDGGATALISFGLAGGLDPSLPAGAVIVPCRVLDEQGGRWDTDPAWSATLGGSGALTLLGCTVVIAEAARKRALWHSFGASAADMESGAVAEVAAAAGHPFAVLRAVCDPGDADLPPAALTALDEAGRIRAVPLLRSLGRRPGQIPALIRLGGQAARARAALLERVRLIGPAGGIRRGA